MCNLKSLWLPLAIMLGLAACSSSGNTSNPSPPPPAQAVVSGSVFDGPVVGATISAYTVSPAGLVGTTAIATATTAADGTYSLKLPAGTSGAIELVSTGGTFTDDATGQTVNAPTLSAIISNVSGSTAVTQELTPMTTLAAQLALATASTTNTISAVSTAINTAIGDLLGGQANISSTPLVDVSTAGCATNASQASIDASLVLAGINQLAARYNVNTADLIQAVVADLVSDNTFDGTANGVPLTVPLSGGTVMLCTIEGNCPGAPVTGLAQQLGAAVMAFQNSGANTCGATESSAQQSNFAAAPAAPPASTTYYKYSYTMNSSVSGYSGASAIQTHMYVGLTCADDALPATSSFRFGGYIGLGSSGPFTVRTGANGQSTEDGYVVGINAANDCGKNTWTLVIVSPPDATCTISGPSTGTFSSSDGGNTNVANDPPTITCNPLYTVGGIVNGLTTGSISLQDNGGDMIDVAASSSTFTFPTELASGATYLVTVGTQPGGLTCTVSPNTAQTIGTGDVTVVVSCSPSSGGTPGAEAIYVVDSTYRLFEFDGQGNAVASADLPGSTSSVGNLNGGGITVDANNVYVTLGAPSTGVAAFNRTTLAPVTLSAGAFANLSTPRGIVYDPQNQQFYLANGGSTVTVYGAGGAYLSSFNQSGPGIYGPSGIAYDSIDNAIWVSNYTGGGASTTPTYGVAEFNPTGTIIANYPTANTNAPTPFAPPTNTGHEMPYTMSYCGTGLTVGYVSDSTGSGTSEAGSYSTVGQILSTPFAGITNLHATACDQNGNVFVAADNGLLEYSVAGASETLPSGGFPGLKAPIYGVGVGPATGLNSPEGLVYSTANSSLYVANSGGNQVLVYAIQTNVSGMVTGMTLSSSIATDINDPVRLALDASGRYLFVANLGNNTVSVYDTTNANAEVTASGGKPLIGGGSLNKPLGVAVDATDNVYVADNGSNSISVFQPTTSGSISGGYSEASFSPLSADNSGNAFSAPGVLFDVNLGSQLGEYLLVGLGPTTSANYVYVYTAPLTATSKPVATMSSVNSGAACTSFPTGPTGIALLTDQTSLLNSQIFVTSYYNRNVDEYLASQLIEATGTCVTPNATTAASSTSLVNGPEGVAVDGSGNVYVSNAGSNTITVYGAGTALSSAPIFTLQNN